jgi:hypothetical protein
MKGEMIEVIKLSDLAKHNGVDLEKLKDEISFISGNMCHLYEINDSREEELDAEGRDDTVLVDLWH